MPSPLTLPARYTRHQPPLGAPVRDARLAGFFACNEGAGPARNARPLAQGSGSLSGLTWTGGPAGRALQAHSNSDFADTGVLANNGTAAGTAICRVFQAFDAGDGHTYAYWGQRNGTPVIFEFSKDVSTAFYVGWYNAGVDKRVVVACNGLTNAIQNAWQTYALTWDASGSYLYRFGATGANGLLGSTSGAPPVANIGTSLYLGASHNLSGVSMGAGSVLDYFLLDTRRWALSELTQFAQCPFRLF